jgi:Ca2+-transporting ATPase
MSIATEQPEGKAWHSRSAEDVLTQVGSSATGLSAGEASQRLAADGPNELKEGKRISLLQIFIGQFKSLLIWILISAGVISGVLGEMVDAIAIFAIVALNAVIGFYQEFKAEKFSFSRTSTSSSWLPFLSASRCGANTTRLWAVS